jgi:hypothetical protein
LESVCLGSIVERLFYFVKGSVLEVAVP